MVKKIASLQELKANDGRASTLRKDQAINLNAMPDYSSQWQQQQPSRQSTQPPFQSGSNQSQQSTMSPDYAGATLRQYICPVCMPSGTMLPWHTQHFLDLHVAMYCVQLCA